MLRATQETKAIDTEEEHQSIGGLGTVVAEFLTLESIFMRVHSLRLRSSIFGDIGSQKYLTQLSEINARAICRCVFDLIIGG